MSKINLIQINVTGPVGIGKSHVMKVIEKALKEAYGLNAQVASYDLSIERNMIGDNFAKPNVKDVVFVITEANKSGERTC